MAAALIRKPPHGNKIPAARFPAPGLSRARAPPFSNRRAVISCIKRRNGNTRRAVAPAVEDHFTKKCPMDKAKATADITRMNTPRTARVLHRARRVEKKKATAESTAETIHTAS